MNYDSVTYYDQEITFTYEGQDYVWTGDYSVESTFEGESEYAPGFGEVEVHIDHTSAIYSYEDDCDIIPTPSLLMAVELHIERNL